MTATAEERTVKAVDLKVRSWPLRDRQAMGGSRPNADIQDYSITLAAHNVWGVNDMRECPPQMQSPAMNSQGLTGLPLSVASFRHVTVTHAGLSLPASVWCCWKFHR